MRHDLHLRWRLLLGNRPIYLIRLCSFPFACSMPSILLLSFGFGFVQQSNYCLFYSDFGQLYFQSPCYSSPCPSGTQCIALYEQNSYKCVCKPGHQCAGTTLRVVNTLLVEQLIQVFWHACRSFVPRSLTRPIFHHNDNRLHCPHTNGNVSNATEHNIRLGLQALARQIEMDPSETRASNWSQKGRHDHPRKLLSVWKHFWILRRCLPVSSFSDAPHPRYVSIKAPVRHWKALFPAVRSPP